MALLGGWAFSTSGLTVGRTASLGTSPDARLFSSTPMLSRVVDVMGVKRGIEMVECIANPELRIGLDD